VQSEETDAEVTDEPIRTACEPAVSTLHARADALGARGLRARIAQSGWLLGNGKTAHDRERGRKELTAQQAEVEALEQAPPAAAPVPEPVPPPAPPRGRDLEARAHQAGRADLIPRLLAAEFQAADRRYPGRQRAAKAELQGYLALLEGPRPADQLQALRKAGTPVGRVQRLQFGLDSPDAAMRRRTMQEIAMWHNRLSEQE